MASCNNQVSYRKSCPLPQRLVDHCRVCLEEQLWTQALSLLKSSLLSGTGTNVAAALPPSAYLALIATLSIHPRLTSQTDDEEKHAAAAEALSYLLHLVRLVGAADIGLSTAFRFEVSSEASLREKRAKARKSRIASNGTDHDEGEAPINVRFAQGDSLWRRADDFWAVVGWAFNCSVHYPRRWNVWQPWLQLMLCIFEKDLDESSLNTDSATSEVQAQSLLAQYLHGIGSARNSKRRVLRAILADGESTSLNEFREIWKNETKPPAPPKTHNTDSWQKRLNLENGEYGDYLDNLSDEDAATSRGQSRSRSRRPSRQVSPTRNLGGNDDDDDDDEIKYEDGTDFDDTYEVGDEIIYVDDDDDNGDETINVGTGHETNHTLFYQTSLETFGGIESVNLRQRFLAVLARFCKANPSGFTDLEDLLDLYTEFLRPFPVPVFQQFVCPIQQYLGANEAYRLGQILLRPLLEGTSADRASTGLSQQDFIEYAAPFAANSSGFIDNAKVSLVVEGMMRLLWEHNCLQPTKNLREAVERGVGRRRAKASRDGRRKSGGRTGEQEDALQTLLASAAHMQVCLAMLET